MATLHLSTEIFKLMYPVGSIYMATDQTSPASKFGGTWARMSGGFIYGAYNGYSTGNGTGTSTNNHTLSISQMPKHYHKYANHDGTTGGWAIWDIRTGEGQVPARSGSLGTVLGGTDYFEGVVTGATGSGQGHSHKIPYMAVCIWRRTG